jgi:hypothetical protein
MTQFAGFLPRHSFLTVDDQASVNLARVDNNQIQRLAGMNSRALVPPITYRQPTTTVHYARAGMVVEYLAAFLYNRIHVSPRTLALGNVVGIQKRDVTVWNANFTPRTLLSIDALNAEGITLANQSDPPLNFAALEEKTWTVQVSSEGPSTVDATLTWGFEGETPLPVHVTGSRLVIWSFFPTWEGGITESLEWKTNVLAGPLGDEQRRSLRLSPRRGFRLQLIATDTERRYMELLSFAWGSRNWAIPIWNDVQEILVAVAPGSTYIPCQTWGRDYHVDGLVLFRGKDAFTFEAAEIASVTSTGLNLKRPTQGDWGIYTKIYPIRTARFTQQPEISRLTDRAVSVNANFVVMEHSDWTPWAGSETHLGVPVFRVPPEESEPLTQSYVRLLQVIDNGMSIPRYFDTAGLGFTVQAHRWLMQGRIEQSTMRSLLYYLAGQWKTVYVPTHYDDLTIEAIVAPTASAIDVTWVGYTQYGNLQPGRRDVMISLWDGRVFFRRIMGSAELDQGLERISLSEPFGFELRPEMVKRISYMSLCRLESDLVEINHQTDSDGVADSRVVFRSVRDDIV